MGYRMLGAKVIALLVAASATIANATGPRSFVASNGDDAHPCTLAQPCRSFATAVANTNAKGEVIVLDSAGYGAVAIAKSITIAAPTGIYAGISVFTGDGVAVNGAAIVVVLRGLSINNQGGNFGVSFLQGKELLVQDCDVGGFNTYDAINATAPNSMITIRNSTLHHSSTGFHATGSVTATLDAVHVYNNNGYGVRAETGAKVVVANSVISDAGFTGVMAEAFAGLTDVTVTRSVITRSPYGVGVLAFAAGTARVVSDGNSVTEVDTAFQFSAYGGSELIYTPGNNIVGFVNVISNGTLNACCGI
jgi:hypothetical protein